MVGRLWTKERIVQSLLEMYKKGYELRANVIQNHDCGLHNAIYYKNGDGKRKYFDSLNEARSIVARTLEGLGDKRGAKKVRKLNEPPPSPTKYSSRKVSKIRQHTLENLKIKIDAGEDVTLRGLREDDRTFASKLERYIGYREAFKELGLDARDYAKHVKHSSNHYLGQLIRHIRRGSALDRKSMDENDKILVAHLNQHFDGYYDALGKARDWLLERERPELAEKADPKYWEKQVKLNKKKKREAEIKSAQNRIVCVDADKLYGNDELEVLNFPKPSTGRNIISSARASEEWLTSQQIADRIKTTTINVSKNFPAKYPELTIRYHSGERHMYLFHSSLLNGHKRRNKFDSSPKDSLNKVSKELGVGYSKLRSISDNLGLGIKNGRYRALSDEDVQTIKQVLERERQLKDKIIATIDPEKDYTFAELEILGIPLSHFDRMIRAGNLESGVRDGVMTVSGSYALDYFKHRYSTNHLSQGLRLITYFHPHLHTSTDLVQQLMITRSNVRNRLEVLLDENPDSCFRIRKSENQSRIITTDEVIPFLRNWRTRAGLQLISMADKLLANASKKDVKMAINKTEDLVRDNGVLKTKHQLDAFSVFKTLGDFLKQTVKVDGMGVSQRDLARLYQYMDGHHYTGVEIGSNYSLKQIGELIDDSPLIQLASESRQKLGFALYHHNKRLIGEVMKNLGIRSELHLQEAEEGLMSAVQGFDPTRGFQFSTYAFRAIKRRLQRAYQNKDSSLDASIGDDAKIIDFISDDKQNTVRTVFKSDADQGIKEGIRNIISDLSERHKKVIIERFGLRGRKRKTLEEIGEELGITKERVRQIETEALEELSKHPDAQILREYLE